MLGKIVYYFFLYLIVRYIVKLVRLAFFSPVKKTPGPNPQSESNSYQQTPPRNGGKTFDAEYKVVSESDSHP